VNDHETIDLEASDVEFPDMHQGTIDGATLAQYFRDLEHAQIFDVLIKGAPEKYAEEGPFSLEEGRALFSAGTVRGLQIRYLWNGAEWWDTLMRGAQGVRIVRVQHDWDDQ
jgi:hypothetical protein